MKRSFLLTIYISLLLFSLQASAYEQLLSTIRNVNVGTVNRKVAIAVTPHIPKASLKSQRYEKLCHKQGVELRVVNSGCKYPLY